MVVVVVPGGLGDFGRLVVDALLEADKHEVYALTRKPRILPVREVDYTNVAQLTEVLASHKVHTVVSALNVDFQSVSDAQLSLIEAAAAARCVKRFVPSEYNVDYDLNDAILRTRRRGPMSPGDQRSKRHSSSTRTFIPMAKTIRGSKLDVRFDSVESLKNHDVKPLKGNEAIGDRFEDGRDQLKAWVCDLSASIALGAYVSNAANGADLVSLLEDKIGAPVRIDQFLGQYWSS
ncbi:hypothetical protein LTR72_010960 [Exophiala xenobiotica]|nr:hypothetical protein LTR72_010960 [Exophiala xenobiotica]KAK5332932.1 hypothetical protein LTR98_010931 [Exophiala xenobiotica]